MHDLERQLSDAQQRTVKQAEDIARLEDSGRDINSQVNMGKAQMENMKENVSTRVVYDNTDLRIKF